MVQWWAGVYVARGPITLTGHRLNPEESRVAKHIATSSECFAMEESVSHFPPVKKHMKAKSWHFRRGVLSVTWGCLDLKRLRTTGVQGHFSLAVPTRAVLHLTAIAMTAFFSSLFKMGSLPASPLGMREK